MQKHDPICFSHPPHHDGKTVVFIGLMPNALLPRLGLRTVKDDEMTFIHGTYQVHIISGLFQPLFNSAF